MATVPQHCGGSLFIPLLYSGRDLFYF